MLGPCFAAPCWRSRLFCRLLHERSHTVHYSPIVGLRSMSGELCCDLILITQRCADINSCSDLFRGFLTDNSRPSLQP